MNIAIFVPTLMLFVMSHISCCNPRVILNPNIAELVGNYHRYYLYGRWYESRLGYKAIYKFDKRPFNRYLAKGLISLDNYEENFVIDSSTGVIYPIYICVPCGHCTLCKERKVNSFVKRISYESFLYSYKPLFITLTYNDKWLPEDGLSIRDVQLFLKRLRQNLYRAGFVQRIRYVLVGEYGKRTHRAHYHAILFGLPISTDRDLCRFESVLNKSWQLGFTLSRQVDMSNDHTAYYTSKYLRKDCHVPDGCTRTFCNSSRRGGGIGAGFLKKEAEQLRRRVSTNPKVYNPWKRKTEPLLWSKYVLDKIYPSVSTAVPLKLRKALRTYFRCANVLKEYEPDMFWLYETNYNIIKSKFGNLIYLPLDGFNPHELSSEWFGRTQDIYSAEKIIMSFLDFDFSSVHRVDQQRSFLLSSLSLNQVEVDLVQKVSAINRKHKHLQNFEVL